jgi:NADH:ubiquinone oxidoreductase subunit 4 (subunit M)
MLWMFQRVMFGVVTTGREQEPKDLGGREILILTCMVFFIILMGV